MAQELAAELLRGSLEQTADRLAEFYRSVDSVGRLDYETGKFEFDEERLRELLRPLPEQFGTRFIKHVRALAASGFTICGRPEQIENGEASAIPTAMILCSDAMDIKLRG
jgi:hypothetical protein